MDSVSQIKDNIPKRRTAAAEVAAEATSWTLSGREAEALHMEEEDEEEEEEGDQAAKAGRQSSPLRNILQSERLNRNARILKRLHVFDAIAGGAIPDAAAIHAARKRRQAAREKGGGGGSVTPPPPPKSREEYIPIRKPDRSRLVREEDEVADDDDEDERMSFTGVKSAARDREARQKGGICTRIRCDHVHTQ